MKYLKDDEVLLNSYAIEDRGDVFGKEEYKNYIKQKPNKKIFGWKFWLAWYNLSGEDTEKWYNRWFRSVGEPPVVFNEDMADYSAQQLQKYLYTKGYFNAKVSDSISIRKRKARVVYSIDPGIPYRIRNINYFFEDGTLSQFVLSDSLSAKLASGDLVDGENIDAEKRRIETLLKNKGYYNFTRDFIEVEGDSSMNNHMVDLTLVIRNLPVRDDRGRLVSTSHSRYTVRDIYMLTDNTLEKNGDTKLDTFTYDNISVISREGSKIKPELITQKNYIIPGNLYNARRVSQTYRHLSSLSAFRYVDVNFREVENEENMLDCEISMLPATPQAFTGRIEGTTSGGNIGAAGNINYQHRNLFGGSEKFDLTFIGSIESLPEENLGTRQELGVEAKLSLPKFLLPIETEQFIRKYNPETNLELAFNYQRRPGYITRTTLRSGFGYKWRGNRYLTWTLYPTEVSLIRTPVWDDAFKERLEGTYLYYSYLPHFITDIRGNMVYTNQDINKKTDFQYLRVGGEIAGLIPNLIFRGVKGFDTEEILRLDSIDYAQYFRLHIDARHYNYLGDDNSLVFRVYAGASIPYMNSISIPFEKQFFGGGANSLRAWKVKSLGPGSYKIDEADGDLPYYNQTADLKLEANVEYRFNIVWKLEGALFVDAGNIWSLSRDDDREGALFDFQDFYKEIAVGTGFGFRLDLKFFLIRFDLGIPLVDPSLDEGSRWIPGNVSLSWNDLGYNIAIGYPF